ncbi:hypothetical protein M5F04_01585 [Acinetobacter sp. ANC 7200]|uniref:hypothetical protein n=1 Tax=Acinetobacter amyesii TaxID=2942470 RepID=UPI0020BEB215|nr:hypothetical protein [Acinetobacter amyesii]MCL6243268.1 hypothetical protein [Acinetobacter amyesii]
MKIGDFEGYLGEAAEQKHLAKQAIKEERFDDAWRYLHEQKMYYQKHANANNWEYLDFLVLDSVAHEDMANILRIEGKHGNALSNISYTYKTAYTANRPVITLEKKLKAYYNRAYKQDKPFKRFLSLLKALPNSDFESVKMFVEKFYPLAPDDIEESTPQVDRVIENKVTQPKKNDTKYSNATRKPESNYQGVIHTRSKEMEPSETKYPEPTYLKTNTIIQNTSGSDGKILGYPTSDWVICLVVGIIILVIFIWIIG